MLRMVRPETAGIGPGLLPGFLYLIGILYRDTPFEQKTDDFAVHPGDYLFKELEGFKFIDQQRILLLIHGVLDGLSQIVHVATVLSPDIVDNAQRYHFLKGFYDRAPLADRASTRLNSSH